MSDRGSRQDIADRCGMVEALGHVPRATGLLGGGLQVAAGHVGACSIAEGMIEGMRLVDVCSARADRHNQFHLVMQVGRGRRVGRRAALRDEGIGGFGEEKPLLPSGIAAHFAHMLGVVAADAEYPPHRKQAAAAHRHCTHARRGKDIVFDGFSFFRFRSGCGFRHS